MTLETLNTVKSQRPIISLQFQPIMFMYCNNCYNYNMISKRNQDSFNQDFTRRVKAARVKRLSTSLVNLIDLKVKGIITEKEFKQQKQKLIGF